jgi:hypothetical protein
MTGELELMPTAAAGTWWTSQETIGVAADLEAGQVFVFRNGRRVEQTTISLLPGVGAFHAAALNRRGFFVRVNFGALLTREWA